MYYITFTRNGKHEYHDGLTRAQAQAWADYLAVTYRIQAQIGRAS